MNKSEQTLYLLSTEGFGEFYIIAKTATEAQTKLETELNRADYGFSNARRVTNIKILAHEIGIRNERGELDFSSKNQLIITGK